MLLRLEKGPAQKFATLTRALLLTHLGGIHKTPQLLPLPTHMSPMMCYYRLYLYSVCGHFHWGKFLAYCKDAARQAYLQQVYECAARQRHPYQTFRIHTLCLMCMKERERSEFILSTSKIGDNVKGIEPAFLRKKPVSVPNSPKRRSLSSLRQEMKAEMLRQRAGSDPRSLRDDRGPRWSSPLRKTSVEVCDLGCQSDEASSVEKQDTAQEASGFACNHPGTTTTENAEADTEHGNHDGYLVHND
jgi:hypothetical protein